MDLNRLLRSPIYPHPDGQLRVAYLILGYSPVYWSFQATWKAITIKQPLLPYIDICCKGYILFPFERAHQEEGLYRSNSLLPFTPEDLGVIVAVPTSVDCPRCKRKKKTGNVKVHSPSSLREEPNIPAAIPLEDSPAEMTLQRGQVTLA